jgi:hypothetical protein
MKDIVLAETDPQRKQQQCYMVSPRVSGEHKLDSKSIICKGKHTRFEGHGGDKTDKV